MIKRPECFTVFVQGIIRVQVYERIYGNRRKAEKVAKHYHKKTRRKSYVEGDRGNRVCTFGR